MAGQPPPYPGNPWIESECNRLGIAPAPIPTGIQPMFAQCAEDYLLESLLRAELRQSARPMSSITYLEIGANHPVQTSNTYLFYAKYGCSGVLVEPNADLLPALKKARPRDRLIHAAIAPRNTEKLRLHVSRHHELSSASPQHMAHFGAMGAVVRVDVVPAITLDACLAQFFTTPPDILSIDIEGLDLAVLEDARFDCNRPRTLIIEHDREVIPGNDQRILKRLADCGYELVCETDVNFVARLKP